MIYAKVFNDVLLQFVGFGQLDALDAVKAAYPECLFIEALEWGSPMTHWVVDGKVERIPDPPTATSEWVPSARAYVDRFGVKVARASALRRVNDGYSRATEAISAGYPPAERESWPVQTSEARALQLDPAAATPWIDAAAAARGLDRVDLAGRIQQLDLAYRVTHGELSGIRQRLEREISLETDLAVLVFMDWPTSPSQVTTEGTTP